MGKHSRKKILKNWELLDLLHGFDAVGDLRGVKFAYAVAKNKDRVLREVRSLQKSIEPSKEVMKYEKERISLCLIYCQKDENGKPLIQHDIYVGVDGNPKFDEALAKLKDEFKEALDKQKEDQEEYDRLLNEEVEVEFHPLQFADVPEDTTASQMSGIFPILADEELG